jgi:hypothetical protein
MDRPRSATRAALIAWFASSLLGSGCADDAAGTDAGEATFDAAGARTDAGSADGAADADVTGEHLCIFDGCTDESYGASAERCPMRPPDEGSPCELDRDDQCYYCPAGDDSIPAERTAYPYVCPDGTWARDTVVNACH